MKSDYATLHLCATTTGSFHPLRPHLPVVSSKPSAFELQLFSEGGDKCCACTKSLLDWPGDRYCAVCASEIPQHERATAKTSSSVMAALHWWVSLQHNFTTNCHFGELIMVQLGTSWNTWRKDSLDQLFNSQYGRHPHSKR